jgi:hypothetical protein
MKKSGIKKWIIGVIIVFSVLSMGVNMDVWAGALPSPAAAPPEALPVDLQPEVVFQDQQKPGKGIPLLPNGTREANPLELVWQIDPDATKYWLWIDSPATGQIIWDQWVTIDEVNCDSQAGTCSFLVPVNLAPAEYIWWVLPSNSLGHGVWSESLPMTVAADGESPQTEAMPEPVPEAELPDQPPAQTPEAGAENLITDNAAFENPVLLTWTPDPDATEYWIWLDNHAGERIWDQWISAADAGCAGGDGVCTYSLPEELSPGKYAWWLLPSNDHQHGDWTEPEDFWVMPGGFEHPPDKGVVVSPLDESVENPLQLTWQADPLASEYWLWIDDVNRNLVWDQWITALEAGCITPETHCSFTVPVDLAYGSYIWWVVPANSLGNGAWSEPAAMSLYDGSCTLPQSYPESVRQWCALIEQAAAETGLPAALIAAVIYQESNGNPVAYSSSGAVGLMQVMPRDGIASQFRCANGPCFSDRPTIAELQDPAFNVSYGSNMLADLVGRYGSYREGLYRYGPINMGYYYADKVLSIWNTYK